MSDGDYPSLNPLMSQPNSNGNLQNGNSNTEAGWKDSVLSSEVGQVGLRDASRSADCPQYLLCKTASSLPLMIPLGMQSAADSIQNNPTTQSVKETVSQG